MNMRKTKRYFVVWSEKVSILRSVVRILIHITLLLLGYPDELYEDLMVSCESNDPVFVWTV
jgi:hypothetical protein